MGKKNPKWLQNDTPTPIHLAPKMQGPGIFFFVSEIWERRIHQFILHITIYHHLETSFPPKKIKQKRHHQTQTFLVNRGRGPNSNPHQPAHGPPSPPEEELSELSLRFMACPKGWDFALFRPRSVRSEYHG